MTDQDRARAIVLGIKDIPAMAAFNPLTSNLATDTSEIALTAGKIKVVENRYIANRFTRFEMLVFEITAGYASSSKTFKSDQDFAAQACSLARAISFEMGKYEST